MDYTFSSVNQEAAQGVPPEAIWEGTGLYTPAHPGGKPMAQSHLYAQDRPIGWLLQSMAQGRRHPNTQCGLSSGPWGGTTHRIAAHFAHGVDRESTILLQHH